MDNLKIIVGILSYNMPHLTEGLYEQLLSLIKIPVEYIILDNGSDSDKIAKCTTHRLFDNSKLTGGMNYILKLAQEKNAEYVWLCTNDIKFEYNNVDPIYDMIHKIIFYPDIGIVHPSLVKPVSNYAFPWMVKIPGDEFKTGMTMNHPMVDIICPLYTKKALDIMSWRFDSRFESWGIDWDSCWIIRSAKMKIAVDFDVLVSHQTSAVYDAGRDKEFKNRQEYYLKAGKRMNEVMIEKYGKDWSKMMQEKLEWEKNNVDG